MPSEKSARAAVKRGERNKPIRTRARNFVAKARKDIASNDVEAAEASVHDAIVALDKAAQKGVIHAKNAARRKARITKQLNKILA